MTLLSKPSALSKHRGYVAIVVALLLAALIGFVATAADFGMLYTSRTGLQSIADAAALAGAATFVTQPFATQPDTAEAAALGTATSQSSLGRQITAGQVTVKVDTSNRFVEVDIQRQDPLFFARVLGLGQATQGVEALAEASDEPTGSYCVKPWFLPSSLVADGTACEGLPKKDYQICIANLACDQCGRDPTDASSAGMQLLLYNTGSGVYSSTAYGTAQLGSTYDFRPTDPKSSLAPSDFYSVRFAGNSGASDYSAAILSCTDNATAYCGSCVTLEPGNMNGGPTTKTVEDLVDLDGDGKPDDDVFPPSETGDSLGRYCYGASAQNCSFNGSHQLAVVPVWDVCALASGGCPSESYCADSDADGVPDAKFTGSNVVLPVAGWATLFIHGMNGDFVQGTLLNVASCDNSGGPANVAGPLAFPIRLVSTKPSP